jgi:hypothetical protein
VLMPASPRSASLHARKSFDATSDSKADSGPDQPLVTSAVRQNYDESDDDYIGGDDAEDSRAILLQEVGGPSNGNTLKSVEEFDPADDTAAAMVHRVRVIAIK